MINKFFIGIILFLLLEAFIWMYLFFVKNRNVTNKYQREIDTNLTLSSINIFGACLFVGIALFYTLKSIMLYY